MSKTTPSKIRLKIRLKRTLWKAGVRYPGSDRGGLIIWARNEFDPTNQRIIKHPELYPEIFQQGKLYPETWPEDVLIFQIDESPAINEWGEVSL